MPEQLGLLDDAASLRFESLVEELVIRESRKARRLILQVVPPHRLELVVPRGTRPSDIEAFVGQHREWIAEARSEIAAKYVADRDQNPRRIVLPAIERTFVVGYRNRPTRPSGYRLMGNTLVVSSADEHRRDVGPVLRQWLMNMGRKHLKPWLLREARRVGDVPHKIQVRLQRTRWGSCSAQRTISLNASLLLLEPPLVRYLMIHEICHMRILDHSPAFWRRVARFEPRFEQLDTELANAWTRIPYWILAK
jgi:predicted metal-dependent hydrolase